MPDSFESVCYRNYLFAFHTGTAKKRHIFTEIARSEPIQVKWCNLLVLAVLFFSLLHHSLPTQLNLCFDHL